jgi:enolase-phosphatase E1
MTKLFLFDVEGTTTDVHFVHNVLFPYSKSRMKDFILGNRNRADVAGIVNDVKKTVKTEEHILLTDYEVINRLERWIEQDLKQASLKEIQGLIWDEGYKNGSFKGHVYPDVKPFFEKITSQGSKIGIYSSGSVQAQKLIMGFSNAGDLTPFISYYFDTKMGHKREVISYQNIMKEVNLPAGDICFFSDIPQELQAAQTAGMKVCHVVRPGTEPSEVSLPSINSFDDFKW